VCVLCKREVLCVIVLLLDVFCVSCVYMCGVCCVCLASFCVYCRACDRFCDNICVCAV
jgi:hypothetical protein